jgi:hypothetical protein
MTLDGGAPRLAMRRFLALLAEEVEVDLPATSAALDALLAEPLPELPTPRRDVSLARARPRRGGRCRARLPVPVCGPPAGRSSTSLDG